MSRLPALQPILQPTLLRWIKFNAVGILGAGVQLAILTLLVKLGLHYLVATAVAVETAVLHNYAWHVRWTWMDRATFDSAELVRKGDAGCGRLWRFHLANGLVSMCSNLALMRVFTGWLGMAVLPANLLAIGLTSILNFVLGDRWVFRPHKTESAESAV